MTYIHFISITYQYLVYSQLYTLQTTVDCKTFSVLFSNTILERDNGVENKHYFFWRLQSTGDDLKFFRNQRSSTLCALSKVVLRIHAATSVVQADGFKSERPSVRQSRTSSRVISASQRPTPQFIVSNIAKSFFLF